MHTTKRAVLLSCSDHYNHRLYVIDGYLKSQGYETVYYTGDFDHSSKKVFHCSVPGCRQIHVRPYRKNLSLARILSHRDFARLVFQELGRIRRMWWWPSCPPTIWPITAPASSAATRIPS